MTTDSPKSLKKGKIRADALAFAGLILAINAVMVIFKIGVGIFSGSHALLASALYSVNDVLSSIAITVSLKLGYRKPTDDHPYGYGKAEFIAVAIVSLAIALGVIFMFFFSVIDILNGVPGPPHVTALSLAGASLVSSWLISKRAHHFASKLQSPALETSASHHHADAEGSLAAIIGVGGAILGFHVLDRVIAVFETLHLIALSGTLLARSIKGLMDTSVPDEDIEMIEEACSRVGGVQHVAHVWSRRAGRETWVDVAVAVDDDLDVQQAQTVCNGVRSAVHSVMGSTVLAQVRFQGSRAPELMPPPGGSYHA